MPLTPEQAVQPTQDALPGTQVSASPPDHVSATFTVTVLIPVTEVESMVDSGNEDAFKRDWIVKADAELRSSIVT